MNGEIEPEMVPRAKAHRGEAGEERGNRVWMRARNNPRPLNQDGAWVVRYFFFVTIFCSVVKQMKMAPMTSEIRHTMNVHR